MVSYKKYPIGKFNLRCMKEPFSEPVPEGQGVRSMAVVLNILFFRDKKPPYPF